MHTFAQKPKATQQITSAKSTIPGRGQFGQSPEVRSILHLQRTNGNQAVQRMLQTDARQPEAELTEPASPRLWHDFSRVPIHPPASGAIQTKLAINKPGDSYEQEADRMAEQVMRTPEPQLQRACPCGGGCPKCHLTMRVQASDTGQIAAPPIVHEVLRSPGQPLDPATRAFMEPRFGHDFSRVRVHSGPAAEQSARHVDAHAYTVGSHIIFGAGLYQPRSSFGRALLAHELVHTIQQSSPGSGMALQRAPVRATAAPVKTLESLEAVAQRIARLAIGPSSAAVNLEGGPGKVISVVRNIKTGQIYVGLNTGTPAKLTGLIENAIEAQKGRIAAGEVKVVHTAPEAVGGHAEVNAMNTAIAEQNNVLGYAMSEEEIAVTFEMHNVWLSGTKRRLTTAPRCEHCARITRGVSVTSSLFKAEGGVSGEIDVPLTGKGGTTGGNPVKVEAGGGASIGGELPAPKPALKTTTSVPEQIPETVLPVEVSRPPAIGKSAIKLAVAEIALNVVLFALAYYLEKRHAEKQVRKLNSDLKRILPDINTQVKSKEAEIMEKAKAFPLVYGNITVVYTHDKYEQDDYNEGSMKVQAVGISHQNYQVQENLITRHEVFPGERDPAYSLTFSVPLFEEKMAEKGASSLVHDYRQVREHLTYPAYKVRVASAITLYKLAKQDQSLETLVVRDLLGLLKDENASVRLVAVAFLSRLKAKIAIEYIREVIPITSDDKEKELIQRSLRELEQG